LKLHDNTTNPAAAEATKFVRDTLLQHDVHVSIEGLDKVDNFVGNLLYKQKNANLAVELVRRGYALLFQLAVDRSEYREQLLAAENEAKQNKAGYWQYYVEPAVTAEPTVALGDESSADGTLPSSKQFIPITCTEIVDASNFYVHLSNDPNIEKVESGMQSFADNDEALEREWTYGGKQSHNQLVAGLFTGDDKWHRIQVLGRSGDDEYRVFFVDFGNTDILSKEHIRPLPAELQKIPFLAKKAALAGIQAPKSAEYSEDAATLFTQLTWQNSQLKGRVELIDRYGTHHITLIDGSSEKKVDAAAAADSTADEKQNEGSIETDITNNTDISLLTPTTLTPKTINQELLANGYARIPNRYDRRLTEYIQPLLPFEKEAQNKHLGVWEYGVVDDEDEEL